MYYIAILMHKICLGEVMKTTLNSDDSVIDKASKMTGIKEDVTDPKTACFNCLESQKNRDYVFSQYRQYKLRAGPVKHPG